MKRTIVDVEMRENLKTFRLSYNIKFDNGSRVVTGNANYPGLQDFLNEHEMFLVWSYDGNYIKTAYYYTEESRAVILANIKDGFETGAIKRDSITVYNFGAMYDDIFIDEDLDGDIDYSDIEN